MYHPQKKNLPREYYPMYPYVFPQKKTTDKIYGKCIHYKLPTESRFTPGHTKSDEHEILVV